MLLAHHPEALQRIRKPTSREPLRVLLSGCLAGWGCGVDGTDYGLRASLPAFLSLPTLRAFPFCPERHALGVPRTMPDIHGGDGFDVLAGRARILDEHGDDLTAAMVAGARAMLDFAQDNHVELAILTDMSAACGSQVMSDACRLVERRRYRWGVGVATALLLRAGIDVVSQRDFRTLARLHAHLVPDFTVDGELRDHHAHPWTQAHLPAPHPRASYRPTDGEDPGPYRNDFEPD